MRLSIDIPKRATTQDEDLYGDLAAPGEEEALPGSTQETLGYFDIHTDPFPEVDEDDPPSDYEDLIVQRILEDKQRGEDKMSRWLHRLEKAHAYLRGDQAPQEDGIFWVVLNLVIHRILTKCGILTAGKPAPIVIGRSTDDDLAARALQDLLVFSADENDFDVQVMDAVMDMLICGLGVLDDRWSIDEERYVPGYSEEVPGNLVLTRRDASRFVFDDENADERMDGPNGPKWLIYKDRALRSRLMGMYPERQWQIMSAPAAVEAPESLRAKKGYNAGSFDDSPSPTTGHPNDIVEVLEYWYHKYFPVRSVWRVYDDGRREIARRLEIDPETGDLRDGPPMTPEEIPEEVPEEYGYRFKVLTRMRREMWTAAVVGNWLLYNKKSLYSHKRTPFIFFAGMLHRGEPVPYGEVDRLMEMQDLINSLLSIQIDNLSRINNATRVVNKSRFKPEYREDLESHLSKAGGIVEVEDDVDPSAAIYDHVPQPLTKDSLHIVDMLVSFFDEISNVAMVQRGGMPYETSGKGIERLLQAGDSSLTNLQRNVEYGLTRFAQNHLSNIQQFMTLEEAWRISDDLREAYWLQLEYHTDPETMETGLSLVQYVDGQEEPKLLLPSFAKARFNVKLTIGSNNERSPDEKRELYQMLRQEGIVDEEYGAEIFEVPKEVVRRTQEKNQILQTGKMVEELSAQSPELGKLLQGLIQNPQTVLPVLMTALQAQGITSLDFGTQEPQAA